MAVNNYGIREGYQHRETPAYFHDTLGDDVIWQPDCYRYIDALADEITPPYIYDIGCGNAYKIGTMGRAFVGVDYGDNLTLAAAKYAHGHFISYNLEHGLPASIISAGEQNALVCSDVIEHLKDPSFLISDLVQLTQHMGAVVISTPDRLRLYGHDHNGMPSNPHHAREWTLHELVSYLRSLGANIRLAGYTRANNVQDAKTTMLIAAGIADIDFTAIAEQVGIEIGKEAIHAQ